MRDSSFSYVVAMTAKSWICGLSFVGVFLSAAGGDSYNALHGLTAPLPTRVRRR